MDSRACTDMSQETKNPNEMLRDLHVAVCGDNRLGVPGLVEEMRQLKAWRQKVELRAAAIAGGVTVIGLALEYGLALLLKH